MADGRAVRVAASGFVDERLLSFVGISLNENEGPRAVEGRTLACSSSCCARKQPQAHLAFGGIWEGLIGSLSEQNSRHDPFQPQSGFTHLRYTGMELWQARGQ